MKCPRRAFLGGLRRLASGLFVPSAFAILHELETHEAQAQPLTLNDPVMGVASSGGAACSDGGVTSNWAARVVTNGGTAIPAANQTAVCNMVAGLISDGVWSNVLVMNVLDPTSLIGSHTPLKVGTGIDPWTSNYVSGDLSANGLTGDGSSKHATTGFFGDSWSSTGSVGFFAYCYTSGSAGNGLVNGLGDAGNTMVWGIVAASGGNATFYNGLYAGNIVVAAPGNGYFSSQRVSTTDHRAYWANGSNAHQQLGSNLTNNAGTLQHSPFWIGCSDTVFNDCSNATLSVVGLTNGLVSADDAKLFSRIQTYLVARGGGFR